MPENDSPNITLGSESCHYLFMVFTRIHNPNTCIHIFIYLPPIVPSDSEADLSNYITRLNIHVQYIASRLQDTNQFIVNHSPKQQSPLFPCFCRECVQSVIPFLDYDNDKKVEKY